MGKAKHQPKSYFKYLNGYPIYFFMEVDIQNYYF